MGLLERLRPDRGSTATLVSFAILLGGIWRLYLGERYAGWEESDYGNLAMARGVLESGFTLFDMNHLPMYYALSAAVLALVGDAVVATRAVALAGGLATLGLAVALADRLLGRRAAWIALALLCFQPEFALYASSSLREPVYGAFLLASAATLGRERLLLASLFAAFAFLTRMDALLVLGPVLLVHALGRAPRWGRVLRALLPLILVTLLWSAYCASVHGTWRFWGHSVAVNLETGLGGEGSTRLEWALAGARVVFHLLTGLLPGHLGLLAAAAGVVGLVSLAREGFGAHRVLALVMLTSTGFWLGIAFTAQHEPGHNLYWKWMYPLMPFWCIAASDVLSSWWSRLRRPLGAFVTTLLLLLGLLSVLLTQLRETSRQLDLSASLYAPQLELARRVEREIPENVPMILDNIPGCWIGRRPNSRPIWSWMDIPTPAGDRAAFALFLRRERIAWVLFFQESWTQAPRIAPFLAMGGRVEVGDLLLVEEDREDAYGWIWFRVEDLTVELDPLD